MLKITSIAIGLLTIVSMATSAEAAPREIYSPSNGRPEVIVRQGSGDHRYSRHRRYGGERHHVGREGRHHRQYRSSRNRSRVVYNSRRSESNRHHGRRHGVVRYYR
jgi:hypothetical protein